MSKSVTYLTLYRRQVKAEGRCAFCGKPRSLSWHLCDACLEKSRVKNRNLRGAKPWQPGKPGRPPICHSIKNPIPKAA